MLLEEPLLEAVEPPDAVAHASVGTDAVTAAAVPSLPAQIKCLALKNLAGSLAVVRPLDPPLTMLSGHMTCFLNERQLMLSFRLPYAPATA
jgi:hypothetical protein